MKTSSAKAKGRRLVLHVIDRLHSWVPDLRPGDLTATSSGAPGEDILMSPTARDAFGFSVECKNTEKTSPWEWMKQAKSNCGQHVPIVIFSRNREPEPLVLIGLEDFLKLTR